MFRGRHNNARRADASVGERTFGAAELEYQHSRAKDFIRFDNLDALRTLMHATGGLTQPAVTEFAGSSDGAYKLFVQLQSSFDKLQRVFEELQQAHEKVGDAKGALQPYARPTWGDLSLKKIHTEKSREHDLAVTAVRKQVLVETYEAVETELKTARNDLARWANFFATPALVAVAKHNVQCADSLIREQKPWLKCVGESNCYSPEYGLGKLAAIIDRQFQDRDTRGRPVHHSGGITETL